jgi:hypothetical protein
MADASLSDLPLPQASKGGFRFPSAVTTLAMVTVLVWVAAFFIPPGKYATDSDGSPVPGTYERIDSPLSLGERVEQLILAPVNGIYGLLSPVQGFVDTQTSGRLFGQIGVIVFIMSIGAFISISFATRSLEVAVASLALADLFPVDQIKLDPGLEGTMEYALVKAGIPALTLELGGPRGFAPDMVRAGVEGIDNVLAHYGGDER